MEALAHGRSARDPDALFGLSRIGHPRVAHRRDRAPLAAAPRASPSGFVTHIRIEAGCTMTSVNKAIFAGEAQ